MIIGTFTYDPSKDTYTGQIATLTMHRHNVVVCPTPKAGKNGPDYRVLQEFDGGTAELGAAWRRSSEKTKTFLSVVLDDPTLPSAVSAALFLDFGQSTASLVWTRTPAKAKSAQTEAAKAKPPRTKSQPAASDTR